MRRVVIVTNRKTYSGGRHAVKYWAVVLFFCTLLGGQGMRLGLFGLTRIWKGWHHSGHGNKKYLAAWRQSVVGRSAHEPILETGLFNVELTVLISATAAIPKGRF